MTSGDCDVSALALLARAVDLLAARDPRDIPQSALPDELVQLEQLATRVDAVRLKMLAAFDAAGMAAERGQTSTAAWLRLHTRTTAATATSRVRAARTLDKLDKVAQAFGSAEVSFDHVRALADLVDDIPTEVILEAEEALVAAAQSVDARRLRRATDHLRHSLDAEANEQAERRRFDRRRLHVSPTFDGMVAVDGLLDPVGGAALIAAIDGLSAPAANDDRSAAQRRADALVELARRRGSGGPVPQLTVLVDAATLERRPGARGAELHRVGVVSGETARRVGCDAVLTRVDVTAGRDVLNVGRASRLVTEPQRRALVVRDGACVFPGCDRPPEWCDAHHLKHWADGGRTDMENLALICRWHHTFLHEGGWWLYRRHDGGWRAEHRDGRRLDGTARRTSDLTGAQPP